MNGSGLSMDLVGLWGLVSALAGALIWAGAIGWWGPRRLRARLRSRLQPRPMNGASGPCVEARVPAMRHAIAAGLDRLQGLSRLSQERSGASPTPWALRLSRAGFDHPQATQRLLVLKSLLFIGGPILVVAALQLLRPQTPAVQILLMATLSATLVHYGVDGVLAHLAHRRIERLRAQLPGFTDLLLVCVESGLGLDAAMQRVVADYRQQAPELAAAFARAALEVRAGMGRTVALTNMAQRCGVPELSTLVAMLTQAEQFGTSLGDALRVQAEEVRAQRMSRAEEQAAKIPVKMLFPLVLCIFPAVMVVLTGPAVIQLMAVAGR